MIESNSVRMQVQRHLFPAGLRLSASALETYARCPFRYFLTAVLGLPQWEEPEQVLTLQPQVIAGLCYIVSCKIFSRAPAKPAGCRLPVKTRLRSGSYCNRLPKSIFINLLELGAPGFSLLWDIEQERMLERLLRFLEREYETGKMFYPLPLKSSLALTDRPGRMASFFPIFPMVPCASNLTMEKRLLCEAALIALTFRLTSNAPVS